MVGLVIAAALSVATAAEPSEFPIGEHAVRFGVAGAELEAMLPGLDARSDVAALDGVSQWCDAERVVCAELFEDALVAVRIRCGKKGCPDDLDLWGKVQTHALRTMTRVTDGRAAYGKTDLWAGGTLRAEFAEVTIANSGRPTLHEATLADLAVLDAVVARHPSYLADLRVGAPEPLGVPLRKSSDPHAPVVLGALGIPVVDATVRASDEALQQCTAKVVAKDPAVRGTSVVKLTLDAAGAVSEAAGEAGTLGDAKAAKCLAKKAQELQFGPLRGGEQALVTVIVVTGS